MTERMCLKLWYALLDGGITIITDLTYSDDIRDKQGDVYCFDSGEILVNKSYASRGAWIGISYNEFRKNILPHKTTKLLKIAFKKEEN